VKRHAGETVTVGEIVRPHGVRGEVVVEVLSDVPSRFATGSELLLHEAHRYRRLRVRCSRPHRGRLLVHFEDCDDRDTAEGWRGASLEVERAQVPEAPAGSYYQFELLECRCRDETLGDLGRVVELLEDGGGLLLQVGEGDRQLLIPFVEAFIRRIDTVAGEIDLRLPPGLVEACASTS
jgi:16S rRNA processing protein RimM